MTDSPPPPKPAKQSPLFFIGIDWGFRDAAVKVYYEIIDGKPRILRVEQLR